MAKDKRLTPVQHYQRMLSEAHARLEAAELLLRDAPTCRSLYGKQWHSRVSSFLHPEPPSQLISTPSGGEAP